MAAKTKSKKASAKASASSRKSASPKAPKYVYTWGAGKADGNGGMKPLLGGKGANLAEMTRIGLPVPAGFTITTEVCTYYYANKRTYPKSLQAEMDSGMKNVEKIMGYKFGDSEGFPLLVSVRSGARDSMPGMMDTILNLGLNDQTVLALAKGHQERALCLGLLPPLHPDVRRRRPRGAEDGRRGPRAVRDGNRGLQAREVPRPTSRTEADRRRPARNWSRASRPLSRSAPGKVFPNDPWDQLRAPSAPSSAPG